MYKRTCEECGFYKPDILFDSLGHCTISGNPHAPEDICEAEEEADG